MFLYAIDMQIYMQIISFNMSWKQIDSRYVALTFGREMLNK